MLSPFSFLKKVHSPSSCFFTSSEKTFSFKICVDSFWNFRFWTLHIHLHQFNIFPVRMSTLPLYSLLLFILFPLVLSFVSPCFLVSSSLFAIFNFLFFLVLDCLFNFFSVFFFSQKRFCFLSCWTCFTIMFPALSCFVYLEKWFLVFVLTLLYCFLFLLFHMQFLIYYFPFFDVSEKMLFFPANFRRHLLFFSFCHFSFFFCSLVFLGVKKCVCD